MYAIFTSAQGKLSIKLSEDYPKCRDENVYDADLLQKHPYVWPKGAVVILKIEDTVSAEPPKTFGEED